MESKNQSFESQILQLELQRNEARNLVSTLSTSINVINKQNLELELQLKKLKAELQESQSQAKSTSLNFIQHFNKGECRFEAGMNQVIRTLNSNYAKQHHHKVEKTLEGLDCKKSLSDTTNLVEKSNPFISITEESDLSSIILPSALSNQPPFDISGKYELLSSKGFRHYLDAFGLSFDGRSPALSSNKIIQRVSSCVSMTSPNMTGIHWERELATVGRRLPSSPNCYCINTLYYYAGRGHTTKLSFEIGKEFYSCLEGTAYNDHEEQDFEGVETLISMESPTRMKQVQRFKSIKNKIHTITIWRQFVPNAMEVTIENLKAGANCVRLYRKILVDELRQSTIQYNCREECIDCEETGSSSNGSDD